MFLSFKPMQCGNFYLEGSSTVFYHLEYACNYMAEVSFQCHQALEHCHGPKPLYKNFLYSKMLWSKCSIDNPYALTRVLPTLEYNFLRLNFGMTGHCLPRMDWIRVSKDIALSKSFLMVLAITYFCAGLKCYL